MWVGLRFRVGFDRGQHHYQRKEKQQYCAAVEGLFDLRRKLIRQGLGNHPENQSAESELDQWPAPGKVIQSFHKLIVKLIGHMRNMSDENQ